MTYWTLSWRAFETNPAELAEIALIGFEGSGSTGVPIYSIFREAVHVDILADLWPQILRKVADDALIIPSLREKASLLDPAIEEAGYLALADHTVVDFSELSRLAYPSLASLHLDAVLEELSLSMDMGEHTAEREAQAMGMAFLHLLTKLGELPLITLQTLHAASAAGQPLRPWLDERISEKLNANDLPIDRKVIDQVAFHPREKDGDQSTASVEEQSGDREVEPDLDQGPPLSELCTFVLGRQPDTQEAFVLEPRAGQLRMTAEVAAAMEQSTHLVIEAGTGTGKSLAYLVPSALFAARTGNRVVIATHTTALQEQLRQKDIRLLEEFLGQPVNTAILKGRNRYLCMRKLSEKLPSTPLLPQSERKFVAAIAAWTATTKTGDREEIALSSSELVEWTAVASETDSCIGKRCPFFRDCFYFRAKQLAAEAALVITNHSLVLSDLKASSRVLPPYRHLVLDEAHHLEDETTRQFGQEVSDIDLRRVIDRLVSLRSGMLSDAQRSAPAGGSDGDQATLAPLLEGLRRELHSVAQTAQDLFDRTRKFCEDRFDEDVIRRIVPTILESSNYRSVADAASELEAAFSRLRSARVAFEEWIHAMSLDDKLAARFEDLLGQLGQVEENAAICLDVALLRRSPETFVAWVEKTSKRVSFHLAPLSVAEILDRELFSQKDAVILTSATLSVKGSFDYVKERLGLTLSDPNRVAECRVESPFDFPSQALLCIPTDLPDVREDRSFVEAAGRAVFEIVKAANGRTMVLFTSHRMLAAVRDSQKARLEAEGFTVFAQGITDHRRTALVDSFRRGEKAVLFGVNSLWEGVDISGEDLSSLVIVKLPFAVPTHPLMEARAEMLRALGRNPFVSHAVPQAVIRFTQGFGRLIRTRTDRGAVFVLDRRLVEARYGHAFVESLPGPQVYVGPLLAACERAAAFFPEGVPLQPASPHSSHRFLPQ